MFTYLFLLAEKAANRKSCFTCPFDQWN